MFPFFPLGVQKIRDGRECDKLGENKTKAKDAIRYTKQRAKRQNKNRNNKSDGSVLWHLTTREISFVIECISQFKSIFKSAAGGH